MVLLPRRREVAAVKQSENLVEFQGESDMFTYTLTGKVLPERAFVTVGPIPRLRIKTILAGGYLDLEARVVINNAQIIVVVHSSTVIDNSDRFIMSAKAGYPTIVGKNARMRAKTKRVNITLGSFTLPKQIDHNVVASQEVGRYRPLMSSWFPLAIRIGIPA